MWVSEGERTPPPHTHTHTVTHSVRNIYLSSIALSMNTLRKALLTALDSHWLKQRHANVPWLFFHWLPCVDVVRVRVCVRARTLQ